MRSLLAALLFTTGCTQDQKKTADAAIDSAAGVVVKNADSVKVGVAIAIKSGLAQLAKEMPKSYAELLQIQNQNDRETDAKNCGACGMACAQGLVCVNGGMIYSHALLWPALSPLAHDRQGILYDQRDRIAAVALERVEYRRDTGQREADAVCRIAGARDHVAVAKRHQFQMRRKGGAVSVI